LFLEKLSKLLALIVVPHFLKNLLHGVAATIEHIPVIKSIEKINTFIDIGANKGQFTLAARHVFKDAYVYSFEPLIKPADKFTKLFESDKKVSLFQNAIGVKEEIIEMHVSNRDDSSSLLKIGKNQTTIFPGTKEKSTEEINVAPLSHFLTKEDLIKPVFVKIDVQGFELEVLKGSKNLIDEFDYIYVECSFIELYEKQALADEVITFLNNYSFKLKGVYNTFYDKKGIAVQADLLFSKR
jgi:FkbM family methyltransferase